jgi:peptide/nickel transport system ATP-binding protein
MTTTVEVERSALLSVRDISVEYRGAKGWNRVVDGVSFDLQPGQTLGLVGESGSGKTVTSMAVMGLVEAQRGRVPTGSVLLGGQELRGLNESTLSSTVRGTRIGMIFQQPMRSLNPAFRVGDQIAETVRRHRNLSRKDAWSRAVEMLERVHIPDPARRAREYPHQFSGGMCQRVMIAIALACEPEVVIADEPTTALDVTVQAQVLDLLREIQRESNIAILFVSHDLGVIAEMCDNVVVMYAGQVVERGSIEDIFMRPQHPYTAGLIGAIPKVGMSKKLVAIRGNVPMAGRMPTGCRFHTRCDHAVASRCDGEPIAITETADGRAARCVRLGELTLSGVQAR